MLCVKSPKIVGLPSTIVFIEQESVIEYVTGEFNKTANRPTVIANTHLSVATLEVTVFSANLCFRYF